jgi:8-oxo-dGTP pyrophosphatase MutT (NUDIX family)
MPHIHEKIDFTVEVFIVYKNRVLLRMHDKYKIWLSVGGHIELHEDPNQAALREVKEEVGLDITLYDKLKPQGLDNDSYQELIPPFFLNRHHITPTHEHVTMVYFATAASDKVQVEYTSDRSDEWKWLTKADLETMDLRPDVKYHAMRALELLGS